VELFILRYVLNYDVLHTDFTGVSMKSHMSLANCFEIFVKLWCIRHSLYWCVCVRGGGMHDALEVVYIAVCV
jgi:hypothetical protein